MANSFVFFKNPGVQRVSQQWQFKNAELTEDFIVKRTSRRDADRVYFLGFIFFSHAQRLFCYFIKTSFLICDFPPDVNRAK